MGGGLQMLTKLGLWLMLGVYSLSVQGSYTSHYSCLFLFMILKMIWKEERSRIKAVQIDNLKRVDKVSNAQIKNLWRVMKGVD